MVTPVEIAGLAVTGAAVIATLAGLIKNWEVIKDWFKQTRKNRRMRFSLKQQPFCAEICKAPAAMAGILVRLDEILSFIHVTREITLESHGMALIEKCKTAMKHEYMSQTDKDDLIHSFIPYVIGGGNGKVFNHVQMAMNLPTHYGGNTLDVDLAEIVNREVERYNNKKNMK